MKHFAKIAIFLALVGGVAGLAHTSMAAPRSPATVALGKTVEPFTLPDVNGDEAKDFTVGNWKDGKATLIFFFGTRCPVSKAYNSRIADIVEAYADKGVRIYAVNSNDTETAEEVADYAADHSYSFPTLKDKGSMVADQFGAQVTPEVFLINSAGVLVYTGQIDDNRDETQVTKKPLRAALNQVVAGQKVTLNFTRAFGSTIKRSNN